MKGTDIGTESKEEGAAGEDDTQAIAKEGNTGVQVEGKPKRRITKPNYLKDYV